ncbi:hypothetical protein E2C01_066522 [Portunus trituberculatus]|uniref:Uncharacterized protein n=1 Tax=Portunus trituberculatus TaxID=210409 RepID=A0A5B7HUW8_PORTR|nr:hypothetical protein [Portunus trituberculatus]
MHLIISLCSQRALQPPLPTVPQPVSLCVAPSVGSEVVVVAVVVVVWWWWMCACRGEQPGASPHTLLLTPSAFCEFRKRAHFLVW